MTAFSNLYMNLDVRHPHPHRQNRKNRQQTLNRKTRLWNDCKERRTRCITTTATSCWFLRPSFWQSEDGARMDTRASKITTSGGAAITLAQCRSLAPAIEAALEGTGKLEQDGHG